MVKRLLAVGGLASVVLYLAPPAAFGAGGAHVVDDAEVEQAGTCHLEGWVTRSNARAGVVDLAPACTRSRWRNFEIGARAQYGWSRYAELSTIGPALKYALRPVESGLGMGVAGSLDLDTRTGSTSLATLTIPLTVDVTKDLRLNLNPGWSFTRGAAHENALTWGAQAEWKARAGVSFMGEVFGRDNGLPGAQAGLRWTFADDAVDLDLLVGDRVDGVTKRTVTVGLTFRGDLKKWR